MTSAHTDAERKVIMTQFRDIEGFPNYIVSNEGDVINKESGKCLKPHQITGGYLEVQLSKDGKSYHKRLHRIVASSFCLKEVEATEVNHIDGNKANNRADNLEWVTKSENMNHAYRTGLQRTTRNGKVRSVVCLNDGKSFGTISEASEYYGVSKSQIYWCCRRESNKCKLRFRFGEREGE